MCALHAVILNLFMMWLNQSFMVFSVDIYSCLCINSHNSSIICHGFNTFSLSKYSSLNYGHIFLYSPFYDGLHKLQSNQGTDGFMVLHDVTNVLTSLCQW